MKIPFSYPDLPPLDVPKSNLLGVLEPRSMKPAKVVTELVEDALNHPIGSPGLEQLVSPTTRVLFLVDDITRQTPASAILPPVLHHLHSNGVKRDQVKFLIAAGTHAVMLPAEVESKLGEDVVKTYEVSLHHWKSEENLIQIGAARDGTRIRVNRMLQQADVVIGIGQIVPHRVMGFTGGGTIVQPGVSGPEITGYTHWFSARFRTQEIIGVADNPVRLQVEEIAQTAGLRFIVNAVLDAQERVINIVAGDPVHAHRRGAELSRDIYGVSLAAPADIVVAESYPADYDLWQAVKGIGMADLAVRKGGVVILVTPCPHGVSDEHLEVEKYGYKTVAEVSAMVERREIVDLVAAAHLAHVGRVICDNATGIMVSPGISKTTQSHLGFRPAATPQQALEMAFSIAGKHASVAVLRQGGSVMPVITETATA